MSQETLPNGWTKVRIEPFGGILMSFHSLCAKQGKPQRYQYCINSDQCFLAAADGGNCCARFVP